MNIVSDHIDAMPRLLAGLATLAILAMGIVFTSGASAASSGGIGTSEPTQSSGAAPNERVGAKYERIWDRFSESDKRWARQTSECESGGDPKAIGGGGTFRGAFQFMRSTWKASPKSPGGDPVNYPYRTQAVVAILLMHRDGAGHWPVCG
jgi:Transglycosylase-like domain